MNSEIVLELSPRLIKFGIVGVAGMAIDFSVTWLFKEKIRINKYYATALGFSVAVINNFYLNYIWTFGSSGETVFVYFMRFLVIALIGLSLNVLLIHLFHEKFSIPFYISKGLAIMFVFLWNFLINNYFNF